MLPNNLREMDLGLYLHLLEKHGVEPNFWCSEEYFRASGFKTVEDDLGYVAVVGDDQLIFPPIHREAGFPHLLLRSFGLDSVWSDFQGNHFQDWSPDLLDLEYIYDPKEILAMEGSRFKTFRKNHRKIEKQYGADSLSYSRVEKDHRLIQSDIDKLFIQWLENRGESEIIHDDSVLYHFITEGYNRAVLYHRDYGLLGINVWDENYRFVNYRYMICRPWPYLDEYMRWLFYSSLETEKMVNDGGILDNPGLRWFKDRMNPIRVRNVYSWRRL